jgi:hypothetical protein
MDGLSARTRVCIKGAATADRTASNRSRQFGCRHPGIGTVLFLRNGYAFGFIPFYTPADCKKQPDKSIFITLCKIIEAFIASNGNDCVLLYHCDHADNKQAYRNKLFDSWYATSPHAEQIIKHDLEIIWANNKELKSYYLGYLTPKSNPNLSVLRAESLAGKSIC